MKLADRKISRRVFVRAYTPSTEDMRKREEAERNAQRALDYEAKLRRWLENTPTT